MSDNPPQTHAPMALAPAVCSASAMFAAKLNWALHEAIKKPDLRRTIFRAAEKMDFATTAISWDAEARMVLFVSEHGWEMEFREDYQL